MIRIRHSPESGVDLEGTRDELQEIRKAILAVSSGAPSTRAFTADSTGSPAPYAACLDRVVVSVGGGPTRIEVHASEVQVEGNRECLRGFAAFFDVPRNAEDGWHTHCEPFEGNRWVVSGSEPMTVSLRRPK
jgi:hypothetical protein